MAQGCVTDVRERVYALDELATLPSTLVRILSVVQDESTTALDLAAEVTADPALTLKILGTVNSSYYGFHRQIGSIPDAVVILGFDEVERLALAISVINLFGRDQESARALHMLWRHSLACSVVAGCLEARYRVELPAIRGAHIAGLLHDIGKAVIAQYFPEAVMPIVRLVQEEGVMVSEAEREVLDGYTHSDIGAWVAERWALPEDLVESIANHHTPEAVGPDRVLTHAAHLADCICNRVGIRAMNADAACCVTPVFSAGLDVDARVISGIESRLDKQRGLIGAMAAGGAY
jgi:putative nucleotidyltransferase with HDIG domain